ncbi:hypothetical protein M1770_06360 [Spiroplasma citri]|uniref:hypothetical protein n=1 Tax=Spiroplasma citri TaxID=2133 RepID=UPI002412E006|nr:hypothetical protein [Spiroplasma citri]WFG97678.1 hypothetical protein M1770_06360 [Spiroplasma citri]
MIQKLEDKKDKKIDFKSDYELFLYKAPYFSVDLIINKINNPVSIVQWRELWNNNNYFKVVYRWNGGEEWSPILKYDGGVIKFWVWKDFKTWDKAQRGIVTTAAIGLRAFGSWEPLIW